ncbi:HNH endonuclease [Afipia carboxidovorans]|uniref:HNH endonuclease n=1 Tax=Afipia carboxidovorans TaxID=40137 RepID=UPI0030902311|nr:HNH endonuclease [Afipia carboxidovorans]
MTRLPAQTVLREWFHYDEATGVFTWIKEPKAIGSRLGKIAGSKNRFGYVIIGVPGFGQVQAHRLAWIYCYGLTIGGAEIDHIDGNPSNNAISNLRLATSTQQKQNKRVQSNNRSGLKGAYYHAAHKGKKWRTQIAVRRPDGSKKLIFLGYFETAEEAHRTYGEAAKKHFGEFARVK